MQCGKAADVMGSRSLEEVLYPVKTDTCKYTIECLETYKTYNTYILTYLHDVLNIKSGVEDGGLEYWRYLTE